MERNFKKALKGYQLFREKYVHGDSSVMQSLSEHGQQPKIMVVSCCDSRVDPALILQCDPGDLFVARNVANIIPPYEHDTGHHGTSAALEFGVRVLKVKQLIVLGHSQCGGIQALLDGADSMPNDFITDWVSLVKPDGGIKHDADDYAKLALKKSHQNCMTFPWINKRVVRQELVIHLWYFDIKSGQIFTYCQERKKYEPLDSSGTK
ncbi:MAG: carbonic anhydrase [Candidatus Babeliales bacterium]|nr:carbonic anhydrase [Candidatus Babeliales bacterium]